MVLFNIVRNRPRHALAAWFGFGLLGFVAGSPLPQQTGLAPRASTTISGWAPNGAAPATGFSLRGSATSHVTLQGTGLAPYTNSAGRTVSVASYTELLDLSPTELIDYIVIGDDREFDFVDCRIGTNNVATCVDLEGKSGTVATATSTITLTGRTSGYVVLIPAPTAVTVSAWAPGGVPDTPSTAKFTAISTGSAGTVIAAGEAIPYTNRAGATVSFATGTEYFNLSPTAVVDGVLVDNGDFDIVACYPDARGVAVCVEAAGVSQTVVRDRSTFTVSGATAAYTAALPRVT